MTHNQHPLGSGFTSASTADDVLTGIDLTGVNVIVTGGHAGLGLETTRALSKAGASVTVGARNPQRATQTVEGIERVEVGRLDLADPASIEAFTARRADSGRPLHILINNAGVPLHEKREVDARGYEMQFATNHLGHFQLTLGLLPALRAAGGARVVNLSSGGHRLSDIRWHDLHFTEGYQSFLAYGQSKTAAVLFAVELDRRWADDGIRGYAVHPGIVAGTSLNSSVGEEQLKATGLMDEHGQPVVDLERGIKTVQQGAATTVFASTSPLLEGIGGVYLKDNDISELDRDPQPLTGAEKAPPADVVQYAIDPQSARRLWELSEELIKG
ncbi:SDR family NAD(P)-dependent oxidoreductase [Streptomyces sp. AM8-1-1]|uniref:SDR family NAD(P)-dependent oxidoreductase n=1 Tax=Streptomyces sp. AM8-1-1 TaxID=3075825 RepID=UPI0028C45C52|nr:SDR family NAD(P)-dependent oxidoreductase [Streptomyces sp. AM8-1-1]WNO70501.1 SDR family NAD(P)-dependent oxidoreductase [Streptomyces sp. AM8-1-1]